MKEFINGILKIILLIIVLPIFMFIWVIDGIRLIGGSKRLYVFELIDFVLNFDPFKKGK